MRFKNQSEHSSFPLPPFFLPGDLTRNLLPFCRRLRGVDHGEVRMKRIFRSRPHPSGSIDLICFIIWPEL